MVSPPPLNRPCCERTEYKEEGNFLYIFDNKKEDTAHGPLILLKHLQE